MYALFTLGRYSVLACCIMLPYQIEKKLSKSLSYRKNAFNCLNIYSFSLHAEYLSDRMKAFETKLRPHKVLRVLLR